MVVSATQRLSSLNGTVALEHRVVAPGKNSARIRWYNNLESSNFPIIHYYLIIITGEALLALPKASSSAHRRK
ncbi:hypothetical protein BJX76DRAFT_341891 [Aspergillus varians]